MFRYCRSHCSLLHKFTSEYPMDACSGFIFYAKTGTMLLYPVYYEISGVDKRNWAIFVWKIHLLKSWSVSFCVTNKSCHIRKTARVDYSSQKMCHRSPHDNGFQPSKYGKDLYEIPLFKSTFKQRSTIICCLIHTIK